MTQQDRTDDLDEWLSKPEVKLPSRVLIAIELLVIPLPLMLLLSVFFWLHGDAHPWSVSVAGLSGWMAVAPIVIGGLTLLGLVALGRFWAYLVLAALLASGILWDILQMIITRGSQITIDSYTLLVLFFLLSGYGEYKRFAASRRAERVVRNES
jgi:hypothetical protein